MTLASACSNGSVSEVERSPASFCDRFSELAAKYDVDPRTIAPVERSTADEVRDLARHAPGELEPVLQELASIQAEAVRQLDEITTGEARDASDVDSELLERYAALGLELHEARHDLCDA